MRIAHATCILVTDGRKMLFFRNNGDADYPKLEAEQIREQADLPDREQKSDAPGVTYSSFGGGRSTYGEADFHELGELRFANEVADFLRDAALRNEFHSLIVAAPPKTLGQLRKHYHKAVEQRIVAEIPKDLVNCPVTKIERVISREGRA